MNEQIEKIYGEACITAGYLDEREFLEKFAQLVVKKVMSEVIQGVPLAGIAKEDVFKLFGIDDYISLRCEVKE